MISSQPSAALVGVAEKLARPDFIPTSQTQNFGLNGYPRTMYKISLETRSISLVDISDTAVLPVHLIRKVVICAGCMTLIMHRILRTLGVQSSGNKQGS